MRCRAAMLLATGFALVMQVATAETARAASHAPMLCNVSSDLLSANHASAATDTLVAIARMAALKQRADFDLTMLTGAYVATIVSDLMLNKTIHPWSFAPVVGPFVAAHKLKPVDYDGYNAGLERDRALLIVMGILQALFAADYINTTFDKIPFQPELRAWGDQQAPRIGIGFRLLGS
jgi:hypothetical protein